MEENSFFIIKLRQRHSYSVYNIQFNELCHKTIKNLNDYFLVKIKEIKVGCVNDTASGMTEKMNKITNLLNITECYNFKVME